MTDSHEQDDGAWSEAVRARAWTRMRELLDEEPRRATRMPPGEMPPLFLAVLADDLPLVRALLACGARADEGFDTLGVLDPPLAFARSIAVAACLTDAGAPITHARVGSAARWAAELVRWLLARGAVVGRSELSAVAREGTLDALAASAAVASQASRDAVLVELCGDGLAAQVEVLVAAGASLATGDALARAAGRDDVALVRWLLVHGADPDASTSYGSTALIEAAFEGASEAAMVLLDAGADPHLQNRHGQSALDGARACGATALIDRIEAGRMGS